jgi:hypothetical protein
MEDEVEKVDNRDAEDFAEKYLGCRNPPMECGGALWKGSRRSWTSGRHLSHSRCGNTGLRRASQRCRLHAGYTDARKQKGLHANAL